MKFSASLVLSLLILKLSMLRLLEIIEPLALAALTVKLRRLSKEGESFDCSSYVFTSSSLSS